MKLGQKVTALWLVIVALCGLSLLLPRKEMTIEGFVIVALKMLLFVLSAFIVWKEPTRKNKFIFINLAAFFGFGLVEFACNFAGALYLIDRPFAVFYLQNVISAIYSSLLAFAVSYIVVDMLFREFKTFYKYAITLSIVGGFFVAYYAPFISDPTFAYHSPDIEDWRTLDKAEAKFEKETNTVPTPEQLAGIVSLHAWLKSEQAGELTASQNLSRVNELYPYLADNNYNILLYRPLNINMMRMGVIAVMMTFLFFGYTYMKDPPQGAYIEKMMLLFLVVCSLDVLHAWFQVTSVDWSVADNAWNVGQYITNGAFLLLACMLGVRLRFITSIKGEFYEQELDAAPARVTRWRDAIDDLLLEKFFNRKLILGRMFVDARERK